ncbi:MAG TPA: 1-acyl-sn-glycerol-3-phosphate acyltransferase [Bacteroidales bacterium]|nr:1-acyl-sn-glycerol-3-phosphate acyltransferase [Bacteroidales bacterium]
MKKHLSRLILKVFGWKYNSFPDIGGCVVAVAPHTSMWDFVWGKLYIMGQGRQSCVLIKKEVFKFPLGALLRAFGGVPVDRTSPQGLAKLLPDLYGGNPDLLIAITPEGTRKKTVNWKKGFIHIAKTARVPIVVGFLDYKRKELGVLGVMGYEDDADKIMADFKRKFHGFTGKHPERFITGFENEQI